MLRQSVMGSDLSYEDMMEDQKLTHYYDAVVTGTESFDGRPCWVLKLVAKTKNVAYFMRKIWVDQSREIPLKEELYAKSGKLLKKLELKDVTKVENRWFPKRMIFFCLMIGCPRHQFGLFWTPWVTCAANMASG